MTITNACPDCNADTNLTALMPGVARLEIRHDDTCPTLARIEATG